MKLKKIKRFIAILCFMAAFLGSCDEKEDENRQSSSKSGDSETETADETTTTTNSVKINFDKKHNEKGSVFCDKASDCVLLPELNPSCYSFCNDKECKYEDTALCRAVYGKSEGNAEILSKEKCDKPVKCRKPVESDCKNFGCMEGPVVCLNNKCIPIDGSNPIEKSKKSDDRKFCVIAEDCIAAPEINPNCYELCIPSNPVELDCKDICPIFYRFSMKNIEHRIANCIMTARCIKPKKIECVKNRCVSS